MVAEKLRLEHQSFIPEGLVVDEECWCITGGYAYMVPPQTEVYPECILFEPLCSALDWVGAILSAQMHAVIKL